MTMTQKATPLRGINPDPTAQIDRDALIRQRNEQALNAWRRESYRDLSRRAYACAVFFAAGGAA